MLTFLRVIAKMDEEFNNHRFLSKINLQKGTPPNQFILYNHVSDVYYYGRDGCNFLSMRDTLTQYLLNLGYEIIAFYSISDGLTFAEEAMHKRFREITEEPVSSAYRKLNGRFQPSEQDALLEEIRNLTGSNLEADLNYMDKLLHQGDRGGDIVKSVVIIERVQNLVSRLPTAEERSVVDYIQNWAQIKNGNVSILIADCEDLTNLPDEITGKHRSGVEIINVGLPNQNEIDQLFFSAEIRHQRINPNQKEPFINPDQRIDLIHQLGSFDCMKILNYFKECHRHNRQLNLRVLRELMSQTGDVWQDLLAEDELQSLSQELKEKVRGQSYAIDKIINVLRTVKRNVEDQINSGRMEENPLTFFFFTGPTGVGKTEVFRVLSEELKSVRSLKISMPEYREEHAVSRLFGAPPGYIGYGKGELGQFLFDNPAAIVLFDEFEKAHPKIWQNFLTMLEGSLTTGDGCKIDLSRTILFFTSNAGSGDLARIEPDMSEAQKENIRRGNSETVRNALKASGATPELIGRLIEAITPFNNITTEVAREIIHLNLQKIADRLGRNGQTIVFNQTVVDYLLDFYAREKASGARAIANHITGTLYSEILERQLKNGKAGESYEIIVYKDSKGMTQITGAVEAIESKYVRKTSETAQKAEPRRVQATASREQIKKEAIKHIGEAVVMILLYQGTGETAYSGNATGIIVSPEGYILTNRHVVARATRFSVRQPKSTQEFDMVIHGIDKYYDLALLKPVKPLGTTLPFVEFGNSGQIEQGDEILILGYPHLVSDGNRTDYDRPASADGSISLIRDAEGTFQLDCSLNPGNSGGPLISLANGEIVGMVFAKHRDSEGMGYAIKSRIAYEFLKTMGIL